jgi:hypothetical protein
MKKIMKSSEILREHNTIVEKSYNNAYNHR